MTPGRCVEREKPIGFAERQAHGIEQTRDADVRRINDNRRAREMDGGRAERPSNGPGMHVDCDDGAGTASLVEAADDDEVSVHLRGGADPGELRIELDRYVPLFLARSEENRVKPAVRAADERGIVEQRGGRRSADAGVCPPQTSRDEVVGTKARPSRYDDKASGTGGRP